MLVDNDADGRPAEKRSDIQAVPSAQVARQAQGFALALMDRYPLEVGGLLEASVEAVDASKPGATVALGCTCPDGDGPS